MQALGGLSVQMEAYPELANENIRQLFEELTATENRVAFARQDDGVTAYNIFRKQFPATLVANRCGHTEDATLLEIETPSNTAKRPRWHCNNPLLASPELSWQGCKGVWIFTSNRVSLRQSRL